MILDFVDVSMINVIEILWKQLIIKKKYYFLLLF